MFWRASCFIIKLGLRSIVWVFTGDGIRESEVLGLAVSSGTVDRIGNRTGRERHRGQRESARALKDRKSVV